MSHYVCMDPDCGHQRDYQQFDSSGRRPDGLFCNRCGNGWCAHVDSAAGQAAIANARCTMRYGAVAKPGIPAVPDSAWCPNRAVPGTTLCARHGGGPRPRRVVEHEQLAF